MSVGGGRRGCVAVGGVRAIGYVCGAHPSGGQVEAEGGAHARKRPVGSSAHRLDDVAVDLVHVRPYLARVEEILRVVEGLGAVGLVCDFSGVVRGTHGVDPARKLILGDAPLPWSQAIAAVQVLCAGEGILLALLCLAAQGGLEKGACGRVLDRVGREALSRSMLLSFAGSCVAD